MLEAKKQKEQEKLIKEYHKQKVKIEFKRKMAEE